MQNRSSATPCKLYSVKTYWHCDIQKQILLLGSAALLAAVAGTVGAGISTPAEVVLVVKTSEGAAAAAAENA